MGGDICSAVGAERIMSLLDCLYLDIQHGSDWVLLQPAASPAWQEHVLRSVIQGHLVICFKKHVR